MEAQHHESRLPLRDVNFIHWGRGPEVSPPSTKKVGRARGTFWAPPDRQTTISLCPISSSPFSFSLASLVFCVHWDSCFFAAARCFSFVFTLPCTGRTCTPACGRCPWGTCTCRRRTCRTSPSTAFRAYLDARRVIREVHLENDPRTRPRRRAAATRPRAH